MIEPYWHIKSAIGINISSFLKCLHLLHLKSYNLCRNIFSSCYKKTVFVLACYNEGPFTWGYFGLFLHHKWGANDVTELLVWDENSFFVTNLFIFPQLKGSLIHNFTIYRTILNSLFCMHHLLQRYIDSGIRTYTWAPVNGTDYRWHILQKMLYYIYIFKDARAV